MSTWVEDYTSDPTEPSTRVVEVTEPKVVGTILGPKGDVIARVVDRRPQPFGYAKPTRRSNP